MNTHSIYDENGNIDFQKLDEVMVGFNLFGGSYTEDPYLEQNVDLFQDNTQYIADQVKLLKDTDSPETFYQVIMNIHNFIQTTRSIFGDPSIEENREFAYVKINNLAVNFLNNPIIIAQIIRYRGVIYKMAFEEKLMESLPKFNELSSPETDTIDKVIDVFKMIFTIAIRRTVRNLTNEGSDPRFSDEFSDKIAEIFKISKKLYDPNEPEIDIEGAREFFFLTGIGTFLQFLFGFIKQYLRTVDTTDVSKIRERLLVVVEEAFADKEGFFHRNMRVSKSEVDAMQSAFLKENRNLHTELTDETVQDLEGGKISDLDKYFKDRMKGHCYGLAYTLPLSRFIINNIPDRVLVPEEN